jgi:transposase InsO family protein
LHSEGYSISELCRTSGISRQAVYQYQGREISNREAENEKLALEIARIYDKVEGIYGYRQMQLAVNRSRKSSYSLKRIYRLMHLMGLKSVTRKKRKNYVKSTPQHVAENKLNRDFTASQVNQKWLTDVTEFKFGDGQKAYLSAILDLYDNSIVAYVMGLSNNNSLAYQTLNAAVRANPTAKPLFHSDRGFQYTSYGFAKILEAQGMEQSMSRVSRCIDNGPMEGFWGKLKAERYNLRKHYSNYQDLKNDIEEYIRFYNEERPQRKFGGLSPLEFRLLAA